MRKFLLVFLTLAALGRAEDFVRHYHMVKKGETLSSISRKYGVSLDKLKTINNLKSSAIYPGQRILVRKTGAASSFGKVSRKSSYLYGYYTVKKGDSLSRISRKTGVSVDLLKKLNRLKSGRIYAGQRLKIRSLVYKEIPVDISPTSILPGSEKVFYKVKKDDTLESIAEQFNLTPEELKEANLLPDGNLKSSQILVIPVKPGLEEDVGSETEGSGNQFS